MRPSAYTDAAFAIASTITISAAPRRIRRRSIDHWLRQRNQSCAKQKKEDNATGKNKRVCNKPEFISSACFDRLAGFFASSALKLFANFRLFCDCFCGLRHH